MGREVLLTPGFGIEQQEELDLTKKETWRSGNKEIIAQRFGCEPTGDFARLFDAFVGQCVTSAKTTLFLDILFRNELNRAGLI